MTGWSGPRLTLLMRKDCGLCDRAEGLLRELALEYDLLDIDGEPDLLPIYTDAIPVILSGGRELCRAPITREGLLSALQSLNLNLRT
ncbi:MAG TPA: glutaredoxin family protein [Dehalococcoidia bacterium]|nr:glutaredoxin family protein [Dehalococcoidia bacterium]